MSVEVVTFGCRLNGLESEAIRRRAGAEGLDAVVVHTCAVTAEAGRQARQAIRRLKREAPGRALVVTGCGVEVEPALYAAMPEVDHVVGNGDKLKPEPWRGIAAGTAARRVAAAAGEGGTPPLEGFPGRTRGFVQVQGGCDHACTFCIIPKGRGPSRSLPVPEVVAGAGILAAAGYQELVLTGVDIASWGRDGGRLGDLVAALLDAVPGVPRLRLSSLDPAAIDPTLEDLLATHPRLMPHVHLSLQAGDDLVLKRMRRRHRRAEALALCARLRARRPGIAFGADLIAGFPTEDEAMFGRSLALVEEAGLAFLHVFPYSPRPGTPASRMPQVEKAIRKERAARLRAAGRVVLDRLLLGEVGRVRPVLVERGGGGHTPAFAFVRLSDADAAALAGTIQDVQVTGTGDGCLTGRVLR
ncbi:MAG: MiaB/RimO family radical SAM methylthiotransferase [Geminicoccaceae bacterium]|nr:MiaB/RimO family radical SAM methylthiotransferase [Geminicoccaceae bacterium]